MKHNESNFTTMKTRKNVTEILRALLALPVFLLLFGSAVEAQVARVQIIHNAADPAAASVDVYLGDERAIDDFAFRTATPFIDLPAGTEVVVGIAPGSSSSSADVIATFPVTLTEGQTYTVIANGVLDPEAFGANPDGLATGFNLWIKEGSREAAEDANSVEFFAVHGATDAPTVDIWARGVAALVPGAAYGDITDYLAVPAAPYVIDVQPAGSPTIVASYDLDLTGLDGGAAAVLASGFLAPGDGQPAFGLIAVLPDGTVLELAASETAATSRVQVIHNAADPAAASVDVYLDDALAIDDFAFRAATPFIDFPAGAEVVIGVAGGESSASTDAIAQFPVTLQAGETYTVIANGVLDPGSFAANPDGLATGFNLWIKEGSREAAEDANSVEFFAVHGATDAPTVDIWARGVAALVPGAAYGDITDYLAVPAAPYVIDVQPAGSATIVASYDLDLTGLDGGAAAILASGFLAPEDGQTAFGLIAVLPDGTVLELAASETAATSRVQVIHNAADPAASTVDVYLDDALAIDDFTYPSATPFIDFPAGAEVVIGVAGGESSASTDAIAQFPVTLQAGETYTVIANGVLDPGAFAANPENRDIAFTLFVKAGTKEAATDASSVEFFALHGSTDAPAVDVIARNVGTLISGATYGDMTDYIPVPPASYVLGVAPSGTGTPVASFALDVSALAGGAAAVVASGFLNPSANGDGPGFALYVYLPDGTRVDPAVVTSTEERSEIPSQFRVNGNYPNPFNPSTSVDFDLPAAADVSVEVFDMLGRRVLATPSVTRSAGTNQAIRVDASALPSGSYVYRVIAKGSDQEYAGLGRMLLIK